MLPVEFNSAAHNQLGYSREEFARLRIPDYSTRKPEVVQALIEKILAKGQHTFESLHRTRSGQIRNILVTTQVVELVRRVFSLLCFS